VGKSEMPVHFGYHPYFLPDGPREDWTLHVAAKTRWIVDPAWIPTGDLEPAERFMPGCTGSMTLGKTYLDAQLTDLERDKEGLAHFWVSGTAHKVEVVFGREFSNAIVYGPLEKRFICIEPQTGPTNAFNLKHEGKIKDLTVLKPGKIFRASYWFIPTGFW
jgi:galactose mutarotase-like enzyme